MGDANPSPGVAPEQSRDDRASQVMKALAAAYPDRIGRAELRDGDWAVPVMGQWFYYAQGRILPEELRDKALEYDPQPFYNYAPELPPWREPEPSETERLRNFAQRRRENPPKRSQHFYDALWQAHSREEAYERVKTIRLFSHNVLVHYAIMEELALVETRIQRDAQTDPQVRDWINSIETLSGWNWRSIADTQSRSFHAYGTAVDILPASSRGRETYWLWTSRNNPQWWTVPYTKRLHPPGKVIKAFEAYGFIWGGKWLFYDTMHFEYRPEILLLNDLPLYHY
ncbi:MAG: M15 family metallopeptidase [Treponema sp.]|nr:M15 family metallopeptidase [Treponema sp.]